MRIQSSSEDLGTTETFNLPPPPWTPTPRPPSPMKIRFLLNGIHSLFSASEQLLVFLSQMIPHSSSGPKKIVMTFSKLVAFVIGSIMLPHCIS